MIRRVLEPSETSPTGTAFLSPRKGLESGAPDLAALLGPWLECSGLGSGSGWGLSSVLRASQPGVPSRGLEDVPAKLFQCPEEPQTKCVARGHDWSPEGLPRSHHF